MDHWKVRNVLEKAYFIRKANGMRFRMNVTVFRVEQNWSFEQIAKWALDVILDQLHHLSGQNKICFSFHYEF